MSYNDTKNKIISFILNYSYYPPLKLLRGIELNEEDIPMIQSLLVLCSNMLETIVISLAGTPARSACSFMMSSDSAL